MSQSTIAKYVTPWKFRREQMAKQVAALRERDGDNCRRCRRPQASLRSWARSDKGPKIERVAPEIEVELKISKIFVFAIADAILPGQMTR